MYSILTATSSLPVTITRETYYMSADPGYDDHELYDRTELGFRLVCPVQEYKSTSADRIKLIKFYKSKVGQAIYSLRSTSIEPLIGHIKSALGKIRYLYGDMIEHVQSLYYRFCCIKYLYTTTVRPTEIILWQSGLHARNITKIDYTVMHTLQYLLMEL